MIDPDTDDAESETDDESGNGDDANVDPDTDSDSPEPLSSLDSLRVRVAEIRSLSAFVFADTIDPEAAALKSLVNAVKGLRLSWSFLERLRDFAQGTAPDTKACREIQLGNAQGGAGAG